ncbi:MAG: HAMP domain-containing protein [Desulfobacterales bacterium]|nr:HAMP domain-containing protein [Desulfobacterales bacterium]
MKLRYGIKAKLFSWFFISAVIFFGTIFVLYMNVQQIVNISEVIINKNNKISLISKKLIENLFSMEENDKKYHLLKKKDYLNYFLSSQKEFQANLSEILQMDTMDTEETTASHQWKKLEDDFQKFFHKLGELKKTEYSRSLWIPESVINQWIQNVTKIQSENERDIEKAIMELHHRSQMSAKNGLIGLAISMVVGLVGIMFLAYSMIRPIRELIRGIGTISQDRFSKPIHIRSKDEFGELAGAFNKMALRLSQEEQMRSDFISMLSHEIRTPLTSIRESVNMIVEEVMGTINQKQRKFLQIASTEIGRIHDLLNRFMQVSRLESGFFRINPRSLETGSFVVDCIYQVKPIAEAKNINIEAQIPDGLPNLMGDPEHLKRLLLNLLDNAIKFSDSGNKIKVRVELDEKDSIFKFSITDNGPGIPEDEQSLIFNKYYQARDVREYMNGVGLGLSISKRIVEAHKGTVWIESKTGRGSTFGFSLPFTK